MGEKKQLQQKSSLPLRIQSRNIVKKIKKEKSKKRGIIHNVEHILIKLTQLVRGKKIKLGHERNIGNFNS